MGCFVDTVLVETTNDFIFDDPVDGVDDMVSEISIITPST